MRKVKLYIATSLNGKIADTDGSVDWLQSIPNPDQSDYGYKEFYDSIDTTIQGYKTYDQIIGWGIDFPYADKENYVFTRKQELEPAKHVEFISDNHIEFVKHLKGQEGKDIWLVGGGQLNTFFLNNKLIDEILLFVMPIVLSVGIELFEAIPETSALKLVENKSHSSGVVELKYKVSSKPKS